MRRAGRGSAESAGSSAAVGARLMYGRSMHSRREFLKAVSTLTPLVALAETPEWPAFRGAGGRGVGDDHALPESWNADASAGGMAGVLWRAAVPGLGHSSPILCRGRIYVPSAVHNGGS